MAILLKGSSVVLRLGLRRLERVLHGVWILVTRLCPVPVLRVASWGAGQRGAERAHLE